MPPLKSRPHHPDLGQPSSSSSSPSSTQQHQQQQHTVMCVCTHNPRTFLDFSFGYLFIFINFFCRSVVVRREFMMRRSRLVEPFSSSFFFVVVCAIQSHLYFVDMLYLYGESDIRARRDSWRTEMDANASGHHRPDADRRSMNENAGKDYMVIYLGASSHIISSFKINMIQLINRFI